MKRPIVVLSVLVVIALIGFAYLGLSRGGKQGQNTTTTTQNETNQNQQGTQQTPSCPVASESQNIVVDSPCPDDLVSSPLVVAGKARVFEQTLQVRLKNAQGDELLEITAMSNAQDVGEFGPFETTIEFQTISETGTLEVFTYSAKDGTEQDKVIIPLKFN